MGRNRMDLPRGEAGTPEAARVGHRIGIPMCETGEAGDAGSTMAFWAGRGDRQDQRVSTILKTYI